jgi:hypothetical protein
LDLFFSGYEDFTYVARFEFYLNSGVANPAPRPSAPSGLVSQIGDDVMLRWNKTDAAGSFHYNIEVKRNNQLMVSSLSHRDGSLLLSQSAGKIWKSGTLLRNLPAGMYTWRVQVVDAGGRTSDFSVSQTFTIAAPPASLTLQHPELTKVILQWTDNAADDTGFAVFRKVTNGTTEKMAILPANTTTFTDHNLQTNQYYEYVVKTERSGSLSAPSNAVTVYTSQFEELPFLESTVSLNGIAADMDNDNDYDLLLRGASLLLKNNGDGTSYTSSGLLTAAPDQQFLVRDIDNDGDQDICTVIGDSFAYKVAFFKNENGTFTKVFETPSFQYITQLALEDFNHDGLVDLLYSHSTGGSYSGSYAYMLLYQQSPFSFTDSRFPFVPEQSPFIGIFSVGDLDNDGFADVFSVEKNTEKFNYSRALKVTVLPA